MIEPGAQVVEVTLATHPVCSVLVFGGSPDITIERLVTPEGIDMTFASGHYTPQRTTRLFREAPLPGVSSAATLNLVNHSEATRTLSIISLPGCYFGR
jgi:hypothetical protein